ncbi:hypothetical protein JAAARDRAFT_56169 [Jaapia argillacea MUCL 33604]|uniref:Uncharacterized protein n=1 Tax=Jaapia argillacea MUCL 33604 TaxID=933084 RepID=A0A067QCB9_9AGAM|nr:hypothetical protein JAAARDRAFT_56169 [Jaapia argillacea MUCL 33604]
MTIHISHRARIALRGLIVIASAGICIVSLTTLGPWMDLGLYSFSIIMLVMSDIVAPWRKHSIASNAWLEMFWMAGLIVMSTFTGIASVSFGLFLGIVNIVLCLHVALCSLALLILLSFSAFSTRSRTNPNPQVPRRAGPRPSVLQAARSFVIGTPRPVEERRALIHDVLGGLIFRHTIFRKHRFEPKLFAIIRGLVGFLAVLSMGLYTLVLVVDIIQDDWSPPVRAVFYPPNPMLLQFNNSVPTFMFDMGILLLLTNSPENHWNVYDGSFAQILVSAPRVINPARAVRT